MKHIVIALALAYIFALNMIDLAITRAVINRGGREANPLLGGIIMEPSGLTVKIIGGLVLIGALYVVWWLQSKAAWWSILSVSTVFTTVCVWNAYNLWRINA